MCARALQARGPLFQENCELKTLFEQLILTPLVDSFDQRPPRKACTPWSL